MKFKYLSVFIVLSLVSTYSVAYDRQCTTSNVVKVAALEQWGSGQDNQIQLLLSSGWYWIESSSTEASSILSVALVAKATNQDVQICFDADNVINGNIKKLLGIVL